MKIKNLTLFGIILCVLFFGCKKEENQSYELKDINIFDVKSETVWDYWVVGKAGDYLFIKEKDGIPDKIFLSIENASDGYSIFMDDSGHPQKAIVGDYIFLFDNFAEKNMDMGVILPSGDFKIQRTINTGKNWGSYSGQPSSGIEELLKWAGNITTGIATGIKSFENDQTDVDLPFSLIKSGNTVLNTLTSLSNADYEVKSLNPSSLEPLSSILRCEESDDTGCALDIASTASSISNSGLDKFMNNDIKSLVIPILSITLTTGNATEVTNKSAICTAEFMFDEDYAEPTGSYDFNVGICYCEEGDDPRISGTKLSQEITYSQNSESSFDTYFNLNELNSNKKYKYCAYIQHDDFIEYGYVNTFGTVYLNIQSWEQTGSSQGSFMHDDKSFEYEFYLDEVCRLNGDTTFIAEYGIYTELNKRYHPASSIALGDVTWNWTYWSSNSSVSDSHTPYVKFKNGNYYTGDPISLTVTFDNKSAELNNSNIQTTTYSPQSGSCISQLKQNN